METIGYLLAVGGALVVLGAVVYVAADEERRSPLALTAALVLMLTAAALGGVLWAAGDTQLDPPDPLAGVPANHL